MSPKLSIITINLNNASGLKKTMDSVFSQTSNDFEYIVVDGGSTDGSKEIILELANQQTNRIVDLPFIWISEPDNGIYHAMNKGIQLSRGEYCHFLNSGDSYIDKYTINIFLTNLPKKDIVYGNMKKIFPNGKIIKNGPIEDLSFLTFFTGSLNLPASLIKKSLFYEYGFFDESYLIVSDWKFFINTVILNNVSISYKDVDVAYFNMDGISTRRKDIDGEERNRVLKELIPKKILSDYEKYGSYILKIKIIKRYSLSRVLFYFIERFLFKIEQIKAKIKKIY